MHEGVNGLLDVRAVREVQVHIGGAGVHHGAQVPTAQCKLQQTPGAFHIVTQGVLCGQTAGNTVGGVKS